MQRKKCLLHKTSTISMKDDESWLKNGNGVSLKLKGEMGKGIRGAKEYGILILNANVYCRVGTFIEVVLWDHDKIKVLIFFL